MFPDAVAARLVLKAVFGPGTQFDALLPRAGFHRAANIFVHDHREAAVCLPLAALDFDPARFTLLHAGSVFVLLPLAFRRHRAWVHRDLDGLVELHEHHRDRFEARLREAQRPRVTNIAIKHHDLHRPVVLFAEFDPAFAVGQEVLERVPPPDAVPFHGPKRDRRAHERRAGFIRHDDLGLGSRREE